MPAMLTLPDIVAVSLLFICWCGIGWFIEHPPARRPSVSVLMRQFRREWMEQFIFRQPRLFDGNILTTLREGTSFFASACMIATGGLLALIGNSERLRGLVQDLDLGGNSDLVLPVKLLVTMVFVVDGFLKFVWAHRLFGYCAVMMAAVHNDTDHPEARVRAMQAADLNITAARSFNAGLRSVYFAMGSLTWLGGPWALMIGTALVLYVTWRREFASTSRRVILRSLPDATRAVPAAPPAPEQPPR